MQRSKRSGTRRRSGRSKKRKTTATDTIGISSKNTSNSRNNGSVLESSLKSLARAFKEYGVVEPWRGKEPVTLIVGPTGSGKSTLTAYFMGKDMAQQEEFYGVGPVEPTDMRDTPFVGEITSKYRKEAPIVGHSSLSETLIPMVCRSIDGNAYMDCPGFNSNRPPEMKLFELCSLERALCKLESVSGILVVVEDAVIQGCRSEGLLNLLEAIRPMCSDLSKLEGSIAFLVTKTGPGGTTRGLRAYLSKKYDERKAALNTALASIREHYPDLDVTSRDIQAALKRVPAYDREWCIERQRESDVLRLLNIMKMKSFVVHLFDANGSFLRYGGDQSIMGELHEWRKTLRPLSTKDLNLRAIKEEQNLKFLQSLRTFACDLADRLHTLHQHCQTLADLEDQIMELRKDIHLDQSSLPSQRTPTKKYVEQRKRHIKSRKKTNCEEVKRNQQQIRAYQKQVFEEEVHTRPISEMIVIPSSLLNMAAWAAVVGTLALVSPASSLVAAALSAVRGRPNPPVSLSGVGHALAAAAAAAGVVPSVVYCPPLELPVVYHQAYPYKQIEIVCERHGTLVPDRSNSGPAGRYSAVFRTDRQITWHHEDSLPKAAVKFTISGEDKHAVKITELQGKNRLLRAKNKQLTAQLKRLQAKDSDRITLESLLAEIEEKEQKLTELGQERNKADQLCQSAAQKVDLGLVDVLVQTLELVGMEDSRPYLNLKKVQDDIRLRLPNKKVDFEHPVFHPDNWHRCSCALPAGTPICEKHGLFIPDHATLLPALACLARHGEYDEANHTESFVSEDSSEDWLNNVIAWNWKSIKECWKSLPTNKDLLLIGNPMSMLLRVADSAIVAPYAKLDNGRILVTTLCRKGGEVAQLQFRCMSKTTGDVIKASVGRYSRRRDTGTYRVALSISVPFGHFSLHVKVGDRVWVPTTHNLSSSIS